MLILISASCLFMCKSYSFWSTGKVWLYQHAWKSELNSDNVATNILWEERHAILNACKIQQLSPFCPLKYIKKKVFCTWDYSCLASGTPSHLNPVTQQWYETKGSTHTSAQCMNLFRNLSCFGYFSSDIWDFSVDQKNTVDCNFILSKGNL